MFLSAVAIMLAAQLQLKRLANQINHKRDYLKVKLNEPVAFIHVFLVLVQGTVFFLFNRSSIPI